MAAVPALALALTLSACGGSIQGTPSTAGAGGGPAVFAPYVDISSPRPDLTKVAQQTGSSSFVLAFALAKNNGCTPAWGAQRPIEDAKLRAETDALRSQGGQVIVATGGAAGPYLENACGSAEELAGAYRQLLDATGSTHLDVDIEAPIPVDTVVAALKAVQSERGTEVTLTLPVTAQGLTAEGLAVVERARAEGVNLRVNAMLMNFPYEGQDWGEAMTTAAGAVIDQVRGVSPGISEDALMHGVGVTVMVGRNDVGMITTMQDAKTVLDFAKSRNLGFLGFWSIARDNGKCAGNPKAQFNCSGVEQSDYEFTSTLKGFAP
jgi:chitinase